MQAKKRVARAPSLPPRKTHLDRCACGGLWIGGQCPRCGAECKCVRCQQGIVEEIMRRYGLDPNDAPKAIETRGRPRLVTTEQVVRALESSKSLREAADKLGVWHGAITMRKDSEILVARDQLRRRGRSRRGVQP